MSASKTQKTRAARSNIESITRGGKIRKSFHSFISVEIPASLCRNVASVSQHVKFASKSAFDLSLVSVGVSLLHFSKANIFPICLTFSISYLFYVSSITDLPISGVPTMKNHISAYQF